MLTKKDTFITPVLVGRVGDKRMFLWQYAHSLAAEGHENIRETVREILRLDTFKRRQELSCRGAFHKIVILVDKILGAIRPKIPGHIAGTQSSSHVTFDNFHAIFDAPIHSVVV